MKDRRQKHSIGDRIKFVRKHFLLNQTEFAEAIGEAPNVVCMWEGGKKRISLDCALKIKDEFGVPLDFIYDGQWQSLQARLLIAYNKEGER